MAIVKISETVPSATDAAQPETLLNNEAALTAAQNTAKELKLLNLRFEETFDTKINKEDL